MPPLIVVPHDGSDGAARAVPIAVFFARTLGASLHLVYVRAAERTETWSATAGVAYVTPDPHPLEPSGDPSADEVARHAEAARALARVGAAVSARFHLDVTTDVRSGTDVARTLLDTLVTLGPVLVVIATEARTGVARALLGSVADALSRDSHVPVLLVPPAAQANEDVSVRRALIAVDGTPQGEWMIERATALLRGTGAELVLFSVLSAPLLTGLPAPAALRDSDGDAEERDARAARLEEIAVGLQRSGHRVTTRVVAGAMPHVEILRAVQHAAADLIAMATHARHGLARAARGSVTEGVLGDATVPILLFNPAGWTTPAGVPATVV